MPSYNANLFNVDPYYDDYSEDKKHLRIMFRPGYGVQARELTQLQTILQNQIERFGSHIFDDGSIVLDGQITENRLKFAKIQITGSATYSDFIGATVYNGTNPSYAYAKILHAEPGISGDSNPTIFFDYLVGGSAFSVNTSLTGFSSSGIPLSATITGSIPMGNGMVVSVDRGVRFVEGYFVLNDAQSIGAYSMSGGIRNYDSPTTSIGFSVNKSFVGPEDDTSLNDPAFGYYNYAAPGADRFKIDLTISQRGYTASDTSSTDNFSRKEFIEFMRVVGGDIIKIEKYPDYAMLEDTLARRTYDESGNYTVYPFELTLRGISGNGDSLKAEMGPGKAYIFGYEFENQSNVKLDIARARGVTHERTITRDFNRSVGPYVKVLFSGITGCFRGIDDMGLNPILLLVTGSSGTVGSGESIKNVVGSAKMRRVDKYDPPIYNLSLYDISLSSGNQFSDVKTIYFAGITNGYSHAFQVTGNAGLENQSNAAMLWEIPDGYVVKSIDSANYAFTNYHTETVVSYPHTFTISPPSPGSGYDHYSSSSPYVSIPSDDIVVFDSNGKIMSGTAGQQGSDSLRITVNGNSSNTNKLFVMATVNANINEPLDDNNHIRTKNYQTANITLSGMFDSLTGNGRGSVKDTLYLNGLVDIVSVVGLTGKFVGDAADRNIIHYFSFDNGQRDDIYDWSRLTLLPGSPNITGPYLATVNYYARDSFSRGPFNVHSYTQRDVGGADYIPMYVSPTTGRQYYLRDCLDFRPDRGPTSSLSASLSGHAWIPANTSANDNEFEYTHYLPRTDKVVLTRDMKFSVLKGIPSLNADPPPDNPNAMSLYSVRVNPYTFNPEDVNIRLIENKRYTMRDIGDLEKRIEAVEFYTTLNILEQDAKSISIRDENGDEMPKKGILVDQFKGHVVADNSDPMFSASIEPETNELRPAFDSAAFTLTGPSYNSNIVGNSGDNVYMLAYTTENALSSVVSSDSAIINPFGVSSFLGTMKVSPSSDMWFSKRKPFVRVNVEGENDNWYIDSISITGSEAYPFPFKPSIAGENFTPRIRVPPIRPGSISPVPGTSEPAAASGFGTRYNDWETLWFGKDVVTQKSNRPNVLFSNSLTSKSDGISVNAINASLVPESIKKKTTGKSVDKSILLRAREKTLSITAKGLKPSTKFHVYCNEVYVTPFCTGQTVTDSKGEITNLIFYFNKPSIENNYGQWEQAFGVGRHVIQIIGTDENVQFNGNISPESLIQTPSLWTTSADFVFMAEGNYDSLSEFGILSTRLPTVKRKSYKSKSIVSNITDLITNTGQIRGYSEPLSQVFFVDPGKYSAGVFLSYVDLYFKTKDSENLPVTVEVKPAISGYPHPSYVLPFATSTVYSQFINVGDRVQNGNTGYTRFTFSTPVYLLPGQEYAISVSANSSAFSLHTATIGSFASKEQESDSDTIITKQPFYRSILKTQNTGKMIRNENEMLCSRIGVCKFTTSSGSISFTDLYETFSGFDYNTMRINCFGVIPEGCNIQSSFEDDNILMNTNVVPLGGYRSASVSDELVFELSRGSNAYVSPVFDLERTNFLVTKNIINNRSGTDPTNVDQYNGELEPNNLAITDTSKRALSRYITKRITLEEGISAENVTVKMSLCNPVKSSGDTSSVKVFIRAIPIGEVDGSKVNYIELVTNDMGYSSSEDDFREVTFTNIGHNIALPKFQSYSIKVAMFGSSNGASYPRIRNLRTVAT